MWAEAEVLTFEVQNRCPNKGSVSMAIVRALRSTPKALENLKINPPSKIFSEFLKSNPNFIENKIREIQKIWINLNKEGMDRFHTNILNHLNNKSYRDYVLISQEPISYFIVLWLSNTIELTRLRCICKNDRKYLDSIKSHWDSIDISSLEELTLNFMKENYWKFKPRR